MSKHTPEPWVYRPRKYDDWGFIREMNGGLIAVVKDTRISSLDYCEYRDNNTDPFEPTGMRIVQCVNACAGIEDPAQHMADLQSEIARLREALSKLESKIDKKALHTDEDIDALDIITEALKGGPHETR